MFYPIPINANYLVAIAMDHIAVEDIFVIPHLITFTTCLMDKCLVIGLCDGFYIRSLINLTS
jgi:hypothetical protein